MTEIDDMYLSASAKAKKVLGPKARFPKPPAQLSKTVEAAFDNEDDFTKSEKVIDDATQEFVNLIVKMKSECRRYNAAVQKSDFGLDTKKPEELKKAVRVRKYFQSNFDMLNDEWDQVLDKLETQLDKIKSDDKRKT